MKRESVKRYRFKAMLASLALWPLGDCASQRSHVDDEAIFHIAFEHALVGFVDLVDRNKFDVASDSAIGAELEHFLRLCDSANQGTRQLAAWRNQMEQVNWNSLRWNSHDDELAVTLKQRKIS